MRSSFSTTIGLALLSIGMVLGVARAADAPYPSKPVRILVGYQAGGPTDLMARLLAGKLQDSLGQTFIVENRPGAGSNIASEAAASAAADGYTLLVAAAPITMNGFVYKNQRFNVEKSFEPISMLSSAPGVLAVSPNIPARTLQELVALAKLKPQTITYGTTGLGGTQHMATELFQKQAGIQLVHIPYKGASGVLTDLIAGHVDIAIMTSTSAIQHLQGGKIRPLAVASAKRLSSTPAVPTFAELGMPGMLSDSWNGLLAPVGTPPHIVKKLHAAVVEALKSADIKAKLEPQGAELVGNTPEEFRKDIQKEVAHWSEQFKTIRIDNQ